MEITQLFLTNNRCYKQWKKIVPSGIVVHSTGANNPNLKRYVGPDDGKLGKNTNNNHWNNSELDKCVHAFIGKLADGTLAVYQTLPWDHRCWGCAYGENGSYNSSHIQFEICEDGLKNAAYYQAAFSMAAELCAYLCKMYDIPVKNIVGHYEAYEKGYASNHSDPKKWMRNHGDSMDKFRQRVSDLIGAVKIEVEGVKTMKYRVIGGKLALRTAATISNDTLIEYMPNGSVVEIIENNNTWACVRFGDKKGYCMVKYLEKVAEGETVTIELDRDVAKSLLKALSSAGVS